MITLKNLITHSRVEMGSLPPKELRIENTQYGKITVYLGPGDLHSIDNIYITYNGRSKRLSIEGPAGMSKPLFDRDIAPMCYAAIDKIKETFGKLEYDIMYLVTESNAVKEPNKPKD